MTITLDGTTGITTPTTSTTGEFVTSVTGFKNRLINGAMVIDQRNAGASITPTDGQYSVDRFQGRLNAAGKFTLQQNSGSVTPPAGYINYLGAVSTSAYSIGASETCLIVQAIEGLNIADLRWGAAGAATVTLSFWVRSSLTGTFSGALQNSAGNRSYPYSYTISAANTWEQKTITIAGDTTGTWLTTNGIGISLRFNLGSGSTFLGTAGAWAASGLNGATGSVSVVGTNGATFYVTGVQLEKGSTATSFDYRSQGTEFQLCLRYYEILNSNYSFAVFVPNGSYLNKVAGTWAYQVQKRATPSLSQISGSTVGVDRFGIGAATISSVGLNASNDTMMTFDITLTASYTTGERMALTGNKIYQASAEL
jgi:hypothetical protein